MEAYTCLYCLFSEQPCSQQASQYFSPTNSVVYLHQYIVAVNYTISRDTAFPTRLHVRPAKTQISLRIRAVWSVSLQDTLCVVKKLKRLQADIEGAHAVTQEMLCPGAMLSEGKLIRLAVFLPFPTREITNVVTSYLLSCTSISFWKGIDSKMKDFTPYRSKLFPARADPSEKGSTLNK